MKKAIFAVLFTVAASVSMYAQPPAPPAGAPPPPRDGKLPPPPPDRQPQPESSYTGTALKMMTNDDFVYDGFYMLNGKDSLLVKFPPHLGSEITGAVKTGSSVSLKGVEHTTPMGTKEVRLKSLVVNGKTISDTAYRPTSKPPVEDSVKGSGKISSVQTDREGRVNGFILNNNTILRLPPGAASQFTTAAQSGADIAYSGMQKAIHTGEVSTGNYKVVHCRTITIGGKQYML